MKIAIFDFDGTLLRGNSWQLFFWWIIRSRPVWAPWLGGCLVLRRLRLVSAAFLRRQALRTLRGCTRDEVAALGRQVYAAKIRPRLRRLALQEMATLRSEGVEPVMLSGGFDFLIAPFAAEHGVRRWRATRPVYRQDVLTGAEDGHLSGEAKCAALRELVQDQPIDWSASSAYGDEPADLPLLAMVGRPVIVRNEGGMLPTDLPAGVQVVDWDE